MFSAGRATDAPVQKMVTFKKSAGRRARVDEDGDDSEEDEVLNEQKYVQALGTESAIGVCVGVFVGGRAVIHIVV